MHEILRGLGPDARVLDLGARDGSFAAQSCPGALVVRMDREFPSLDAGAARVQADAARLPFRENSFDAVIANHSLEHMDHLDEVLREVGRVVRPDGALYIAVPDASSLTDRLYRWLFRGGGHVQMFHSPAELTRRIVLATGLQPVATRVLHTSLVFLQRRTFHPRPPRRLWLVGNGKSECIAVLSYILRVVDRALGSRTSVYGWSSYFGNIPEQIETAAWTNVCVSCGDGNSAALLNVTNRVCRRLLILKSYDCPRCGAWNLFTEDPEPLIRAI